MLNRTNRTLSATLNRLNLGTRSLATQADVINGDQTLRIGHVHQVVMREGRAGFSVVPIPIWGDAIPVIPSSPSVSPWLAPSAVMRPEAELAAAMSSAAGTPCRRRESQEPSLEPTSAARPAGSKSYRKPLKGKRWDAGRALGYDASARAALAATDAALLAASGG